MSDDIKRLRVSLAAYDEMDKRLCLQHYFPAGRGGPITQRHLDDLAEHDRIIAFGRQDASHEHLVTRVFHEDEEIFAFADGLPLNDAGDVIGADLNLRPYAVEISSLPRKKPFTEEQRTRRLKAAFIAFALQCEASGDLKLSAKTFERCVELMLAQAIEQRLSEFFGLKGGSARRSEAQR